MPTFGENLVAIRKQKGITQKDLAEKIGITATRLNYWEKDKRKPGLDWVKILAEALDVPSSALINWQQYENSLLDEEQYEQYEAFRKYLKFWGYSVDIEVDSEIEYQDEYDEKGNYAGKSQIVIPVSGALPYYYVTGNGMEIKLSESEFQQFQEAIKKAVEFELYQRKK